MFINRDWNRSEKDDFTLRVKDHIGTNDGATPLYNNEGVVVGWQIKPLYE